MGVAIDDFVPIYHVLARVLRGRGVGRKTCAKSVKVELISMGTSICNSCILFQKVFIKKMGHLVRY